MSEDKTSIKCKLNKSALPEARKLIEKYSASTSANEIQIDINRGKLISSVQFSTFNECEIKDLHSDLMGIGAKDIFIEFYFEQVGETLYFTDLNNNFRSFHSEKEIKQAQKDLENSVDLSKFDFKKVGIEHTGVIRLLISSKSNRTKITELFGNTVNFDSKKIIEYFSYNFKNILQPKATGLIALCESNFVGNKPWIPIFRELLKRLKFTFSQGDYIYIGFDLFELEYNEYSIEELIEILPLIFDRIKGVKKIWIKFKLGSNHSGTSDLFVRWPGNHEGGPVHEVQTYSKSTGYDVWDGNYS